jgi:signal transduction histidine kinase/ligand-binding sensor protein
VVSRLTDVVPLPVLQTFQAGFSVQQGVPLAILEPVEDGFRYITPFDATLNRSAFCRYLRTLPDGNRLCQLNDLQAAEEIMAEGPGAQARFYKCHAGLASVAIPIRVAGKVVAIFFSGQKLLPGTLDDVQQWARTAGATVPGADAEFLCEQLGSVEERTPAEMMALVATLEEQARLIASLGQDRYDAERRLRHEMLLGELSHVLAHTCESDDDLAARLCEILEKLRQFFSLSYCIMFTRNNPEAEQILPVAWASVTGKIARDCKLPILERPAGARLDEHLVIYGRDDVARFLQDNHVTTRCVEGAQALICDFGGPGERITVTVIGPPADGEGRDHIAEAGPDFLSRFQAEIGLRARAARLLLDLQRSNDERVRFMAQLTHEINAGLQTIVEETEWVEYYATEMAHIDDPDIVEPLKKTVREVIRLKNRARASLFHLRGGMPRREYEVNVVHPISRLVADCVDPFRGVAAARNISIDIDSSIRSLPAIPFDWEMTQIALINLIDNAVKYSHYNRRIRIHGSVDGGAVVISIEDFGLGIPPEDYKRIFQPYVRGEQRDPRRFIWGSGLGLAVAKEIIETQAGSIAVESRPTSPSDPADPQRAWENFITTFTVRLPLTQEVDGDG